MSDIVLWYDCIENGTVKNNLRFDSEMSIANSTVRLPDFLIRNKVDFDMSTTAYASEYFYKKYSNLKSFYPIEFSYYNKAKDKTENLPITDHWFFKKDFIGDIEILIWYPIEAFELTRNDPINKIFDLIHSRFPEIKIRFIFGNFTRPKHVPSYVNYKCFKNFFWYDTVTKLRIPTRLDRNKDSKYDFITLNKRYREFRYMVFNDLKNSGMLSNAKYTNIFDVITVMPDPVLREKFVLDRNKMILKFNTIVEDSEFIEAIQTNDYFEELYKHTSNVWTIKHIPNNIKLPELDLTNCSYLEVVNETVFDSVSGLFITEKTFRAIAMGHIFLICGQPGLLEHLKQEGFQTFDDLFDESYDSIRSFSQRWAIIKKNLQLWISMSEIEKKSYYMKSFDKLVHNQNLLYNRDFKTEIASLFGD